MPAFHYSIGMLNPSGSLRTICAFVRPWIDAITRPRTAGARAALALAAASASALAQTSTSPLAAPPNGMREAELGWNALVNATVHIAPGRTITNATVVIRDGLIVSVLPGNDADGDGKPEAPPAPPGARAWDCTGLHLYAGFIDPFVEVDVPAPAASPATHWNALITPQRDAVSGPGIPRDAAEQLRRLGFAAAGISPRSGIIRGTTGVVSLGTPPDDASRPRPPVYQPAVFLAAGFDTGGFGGGGGYPSSRMGSIALMRQSFIDAAWQRDARAAGHAVPPNCLDLLTEHARPMLFDAQAEIHALRAAYLAEEFGRDGVIVGSGNEVRMLAPITQIGWPLILPLNFPETPDLSSVGRIDGISLTELMTWEQVPTGPRRFDAAGVEVSLTTARIRRRDQFDDNLRRAIAHGLPAERALAMLTTNPARLLGVADRLGTIEPGKVASIVVCSGDVFAEGTTIRDVWIDGVRHEITAAPDPRLDGAWDITIFDGPSPAAGVLTFESGRRITARIGDEPLTGRNARLTGSQATFLIDSKSPGEEGEAVASATLIGPDTMIGQSVLPSGRIVHFTASRRPPGVDPSGVWSVAFPGAEDARQITYTIRNNRIVYEGEAARRTTVRDFKVEGNVLTYTVETRTAPESPQTAPNSGDQDNPADDPGDATADQPVPEAAAPQPPARPITTRVRATIDNDTMTGVVITADGAEIPFTGTRSPLPPEEPRTPARPEVPEVFGYPFGPYARTELPPQETLIFRNATIWTSGPAGIIQNGAMMVSGGKILYVGGQDDLNDLLARIRLASPPREIDASGLHITPGMIDCHSHTGLTEINEGGQSCTAEVRIADAADHTDISWYRQLAGGVTTVNSLHGSANAIGGQNLIRKPRWGSTHPWDFFFEGAPEGIKFALGENPKRGNSSGTLTRYPSTRMGVEAVIRDRFTAARQYAQALERFAARGGLPPRRDLELEALAEVLAGTRLVHAHSYRADEILMLCRVAQDFGFRIGTFQHALEVYKVAPEVREAAIGASAFSDWWAFKVEVQDAIPYAGALMHEMGIITSFNSDDNELARRLNIEAAKAVRYGGVDPAEALKFVTINPAIQLGIDDRVGSLEAGKDADFALWSASPLSTLARCTATYIDGRCYFSLEDDARMREANAAERRRIIQRILADSRPAERSTDRPADAPATGRPARPGVLALSEAVARDALSAHHLDLIRRGMDPDAPVCGDCGMTLLDLMNR